MKQSKRFLSVILAALMVFSLLPSGSLAATANDQASFVSALTAVSTDTITLTTSFSLSTSGNATSATLGGDKIIAGINSISGGVKAGGNWGSLTVTLNSKKLTWTQATYNCPMNLTITGNGTFEMNSGATADAGLQIGNMTADSIVAQINGGSLSAITAYYPNVDVTLNVAAVSYLGAIVVMSGAGNGKFKTTGSYAGGNNIEVTISNRAAGDTLIACDNGANAQTLFDKITWLGTRAGHEAYVEGSNIKLREIPTTHEVTVSPGAGMTITSGNGTQTINVGDSIATITVTANAGYTLPAGYTLSNGLVFTNNGNTGAVTGAPSTGSTVTITDATHASYSVTAGTLSNLSLTSGGSATHGTNYTGTLTVTDGAYTMPATINVSIGGGADTPYNVTGGTFTIPGAAIIGNIVISGSAIAPTTYSVTNRIANTTLTNTGANMATHGTQWTGTLEASSGYTLPSSITVTVGGTSLTAVTHYTYDSGTGVITILAANVTGNIEVTGTAEVVIPSSVTVGTGGTYATLAAAYAALPASGGTITLTGDLTAASYINFTDGKTVTITSDGANVYTIKAQTGANFGGNHLLNVIDANVTLTNVKLDTTGATNINGALSVGAVSGTPTANLTTGVTITGGVSVGKGTLNLKTGTGNTVVDKITLATATDKVNLLAGSTAPAANIEVSAPSHAESGVLFTSTAGDNLPLADIAAKIVITTPAGKIADVDGNNIVLKTPPIATVGTGGTYATLAAAYAALPASGGEIRVLSNLNMPARTKFDANKTVTITSEGGQWTITATYAQPSDHDGMLYIQNGSVTLKNIIFDQNTLIERSVVGVNANASLTIEDGAWLKNGGKAGTDTKGVWLNLGATLTMTGGKISDCIGQGVYLNETSEFIMTGGEISNNTGYGVYSSTGPSNGKVRLSGKPVITGNTEGNLCLWGTYNGSYSFSGDYKITGALESGANVGLTPCIYYGSPSVWSKHWPSVSQTTFDVLKGAAGYEVTASDIEKLHADDTTQAGVMLKNTGVGNTVQLGTHGTSANFPIILTATNIRDQLSNTVSTALKYYVLDDDIVFSEGTGNWLGIKDFWGHLDGRGHSVTITGNITGYSNTHTGFFGQINGGTVKNLVVKVNGVVNGYGNYVGGFVGYLASGRIDNCGVVVHSVTGNIAVGSVGGFVGESSGIINNCFAQVTAVAAATTGPTGGRSGGGFVGFIRGGNIKNSYTTVRQITTASASTAERNGSFYMYNLTAFPAVDNCYHFNNVIGHNILPTQSGAAGMTGSTGKTLDDMKAAAFVTALNTNNAGAWTQGASGEYPIQVGNGAVTGTLPVYVGGTVTDNTKPYGSEENPYISLANAYAAINGGGEICLQGNLEVSAVTNFNADKMVTITSGAGGPFTIKQTVNNIGTFNITNGHIILENIIIDGGKGNTPSVSFNANTSAGISVSGGTAQLTMLGGAVVQNFKKDVTTANAGYMGTAIMVSGGALFTMDDGTIKDNLFTRTTVGQSEGVAVEVTGNGSRFVMNGGLITSNVFENTDTSGGGAISSNGGTATITINGGTISDNSTNLGISAIRLQGGTTAATAATLNLNGGSITDNTSGSNDGAIGSLFSGKINIGTTPESTNTLTITSNKGGGTECNLSLDGYTSSYPTIAVITGTLKAASKVGIYTKNMPTGSATRNVATGGNSTSKDYFQSDKPDVAGIELSGTVIRLDPGAVTAPATGVTVYVKAGGTGNGTTSASPFGSLAAALAALPKLAPVTGTHEIRVASNLDVSTGTLNINNNKVKIVSDNGSGGTPATPYTITLIGGTLTNSAMLNVTGGATVELENIKLNANKKGRVLYVDGAGTAVTLGTGAALTGGAAVAEGAGAYVATGAALTINGGTVTANTTAGTGETKGGGVAVNGGTLTLTTGTIENNTAVGTTGTGGGVAVYNDSTFNMNGGSITGNKANLRGGGVASMGTFNMQGAVSITGNTNTANAASNVFLYALTGTTLNTNHKPIALTGALTGSGKIGVSLGVMPAPGATADIATNVTTDQKEYFTADYAAADADIEYNGTTVRFKGKVIPATPLYVQAGGSGDGSTSGSPLGTLEAAYAAATTANTPYEIVLMSDITLNATVNFNANKAITIRSKDGEQYTIKRGNAAGPLLNITQGSVTLENVIFDGQGGINSLGGSLTGTGALISVGNSSASVNPTLTLGDGAILQNSSTNCGVPAINVGGTSTYSGTLNILDGSIIRDNTATGYYSTSVGSTNTGAIAVSGSNTQFYMSGGLIEKNSGGYSGAITICGTDISTGAESRYILSGGTIQNNTSSTGSGAILVDTQAKLYITGGTITGNTGVVSMGGGVGLWSSNSYLYMSGNPVITGNKDTTGAVNNVRLNTGRTIEMKGALTTGANVGVSLNTMPTATAKIVDVATGSFNPTTDINFFKSDKLSTAGIDNSGTTIRLSWDAKQDISLSGGIKDNGDGYVAVTPSDSSKKYVLVDADGKVIETKTGNGGELTFSVCPGVGYKVVEIAGSTANPTPGSTAPSGTTYPPTGTLNVPSADSGAGGNIGMESMGDGKYKVTVDPASEKANYAVIGGDGVIISDWLPGTGVVEFPNLPAGTYEIVTCPIGETPASPVDDKVGTGTTIVIPGTGFTPITPGVVIREQSNPATNDKITLSSTDSDQQYALIDKATGEVVDAGTNGGWKDGGSLIIFDNLDPDKEYEVVTREKTPATALPTTPVVVYPRDDKALVADDSSNGKVTAVINDNGTSGDTSDDTVTITVNTPDANTEYAIVKVDPTTGLPVAAPDGYDSGWTSGSPLTFTGLDPDAAYKIVTRDKTTAANPTPTEALVGSGLTVNPPSADINTETTETGRAPGNPTGKQQITVTATESDQDYILVPLDADGNPNWDNAVAATGGVSAGGKWVTGDGDGITFDGLDPEKDYQIFTRDTGTPASLPVPGDVVTALTAESGVNASGEGYIEVEAKSYKAYAVLPAGVMVYDANGTSVTAGTNGWYSTNTGKLIFRPLTLGTTYKLVSTDNTTAGKATPPNQVTGTDYTVPVVGGNVSANSATEIVINPSDSSLKYAVATRTGTDPNYEYTVADVGVAGDSDNWQNSSEGNGLIFSPLTPKTEYFIIATSSSIVAPGNVIPGTDIINPAISVTTPGASTALPDGGNVTREQTGTAPNIKDKITVNPTDADQEYALVDSNGNIVSEWKGGDGNAVTFDSLNSGEIYKVITREEAGNGTLSLPTQPMPVYPIGTPDGLAVNNGTVTAATSTSITISDVDSDKDYAVVLLDANGNPIADAVGSEAGTWVSGTTSPLTFDDLTPDGTYKIVTRDHDANTAAHPTPAEAAIGSGLVVTLPSATIDIPMTEDNSGTNDYSRTPCTTTGKDKITVHAKSGQDYILVPVGATGPEWDNAVTPTGGTSAGDGWYTQTGSDLTYDNLDPKVTYQIYTRDTGTSPSIPVPGKAVGPIMDAVADVDKNGKGYIEVTAGDILYYAVVDKNTPTGNAPKVYEVGANGVETEITANVNGWYKTNKGKLVFRPLSLAGSYELVSAEKTTTHPASIGGGKTLTVPVAGDNVSAKVESDNSVTVTIYPSDVSLKYALIDPNNSNALIDGWDNGGDKITFIDLTADTEYKIVTIPSLPGTEPTEPIVPGTNVSDGVSVTTPDTTTALPGGDIVRTNNGTTPETDKITINHPATGQEYALLDSNGNIVSGWIDGSGTVVFDNLDPDEAYQVVTRETGSGTPSLPLQPTPVYPIGTPAGLADGNGTVTAATNDDGVSYAITIAQDKVDTNKDYAVVKIDPTTGNPITPQSPATAWKPGTTTPLTFTGLDPDSTYKIVTRDKNTNLSANPKPEDAVFGSGLEIRTPSATLTMPTFTHTDDGTTAGTDKITITNVDTGQEYILVPVKNGKPDWTGMTDWTKTTFDNLDPNTTYQLFTRDKAVAGVTPASIPATGAKIVPILKADAGMDKNGKGDIEVAAGDGVYYAVVAIDPPTLPTLTVTEVYTDENGAEKTRTVTADNGWYKTTNGGKLVFKPLNPMGTYELVSTDNPSGGVPASVPNPANQVTIPVAGDNISSKQIDSDGNGVLSVGDETAIVIDNSNTGLKYALLDGSNNLVDVNGDGQHTTADWLIGTGGTLTFSPLPAGTDYKVVAVPSIVTPPTTSILSDSNVSDAVELTTPPIITKSGMSRISLGDTDKIIISPANTLLTYILTDKNGKEVASDSGKSYVEFVDLTPGETYYISAKTTGQTNGMTSEPIEIKPVDGSISLSGKVVNESGNAVGANVEVKIVVLNTDGTLRSVTAKTKTDGTYEIAANGIKPGNYTIYTNGGSNAGTAVADVTIGTLQPQQLQTLKLNTDQTGIIGGTVTAGGASVSGKMVSVIDKQTGQPVMGASDSTSDAGGYVLTNMSDSLPAGSYIVQISDGGYSGMTEITVNANGTISPNTNGKYTSANIGMTPGGLLSGTADGLNAGETATINVTVPVYDSGNNVIGAKTLTAIAEGTGGYYQFAGVPDGSYTVTLTDANNNSATKPITSGATTVDTFTLTAGLTADNKTPLRGTILDADGKPVNSATVTLYKADGTKVGVTATTGTGGGYTLLLDGLTEGESYYVSADGSSKNGLAGPIQVQNDGGIIKLAGKANITLGTDNGNMLTGKVTLKDGTTAEKATVIVKDSSGNVIAKTITNADGQYFVASVPAGAKISITAKNGEVINGVTLSADSTIYRNNITTDSPPTSQLTVIDTHGAPLALAVTENATDAKVTLTDSSGTVVTLPGDILSGGVINVASLSSLDTYTVRIEKNGMDYSKPITVVDGDTGIVIQTGQNVINIPSYKVTGTLNCGTSSAQIFPADATVKIYDPDSSFVWGEVKVGKNDGKFSVSGIPSGDYYVTMTVKDPDNSYNDVSITAKLNVNSAGDATFNPMADLGGGVVRYDVTSGSGSSGANLTVSGSSLTVTPSAAVNDIYADLTAVNNSSATTAELKAAIDGFNALTPEQKKQVSKTTREQVAARLKTKLESEISLRLTSSTAEGVIDSNKTTVETQLTGMSAILVSQSAIDAVAAAKAASEAAEAAKQAQDPTAPLATYAYESSLALQAEDVTNDLTGDIGPAEAVANNSEAGVGLVFDINVKQTVIEKKVEDGTPTTRVIEDSTVIDELPESVSIKLSVPTELQGYKNYALVHIHKGKAKMMSATVVNGVLSFNAQQFSLFVLLYSDDPIIDSETDTDDSGTPGTPGTPGTSGAGGSGAASNAAIKTDGNGTIILDPSNPASGQTVTVTAKPNAGYELATLIIRDSEGNAVILVKNSDGTYTYTQPDGVVEIEATFKKITILDSDVSALLITDDHVAYMSGRGNNQFAPNANMSRAEAAQMFFNLLRDQNVAITKTFPDVADSAWYAKAVKTLASLGIINGSTDGSFHPNDNITRAQFAAIAVRFAKLSQGVTRFSDVSSTHWAYQYINTAANFGWVNGVGNGKFEPERNITRAEAVTIVNRMLNRVPDKTAIDTADGLVKFTDVAGHWAFYDIAEATNSHDYENDGKTETWKKDEPLYQQKKDEEVTDDLTEGTEE